MWHFKTHFGTIWIVEEDSKIFLGIDQDTVGTFASTQDALEAVNSHFTGHAAWDAKDKIRVPMDLDSWLVGEPAGW